MASSSSAHGDSNVDNDRRGRSRDFNWRARNEPSNRPTQQGGLNASTQQGNRWARLDEDVRSPGRGFERGNSHHHRHYIGHGSYRQNFQGNFNNYSGQQNSPNRQESNYGLSYSRFRNESGGNHSENRNNFRQRNGAFGQKTRHFLDPPRHDILPRALHQLARVLMLSNPQLPSYRDDVKNRFILPFCDDDTQVSLVNHYGEVFTHLTRACPKVMNYNYSVTDQTNTRSKIEAAVRDTITTMHQVSDQKQFVEVDFLKLVITNPKPPLTRSSDSISANDLVTKLNEKSPEIPSYLHRMSLPDGEEFFLDILQHTGVVVEESGDQKSTVKLEIYVKGFEYENQILSGCIQLNSADLSFTKWSHFRWLSDAYILPNPGQERGSEFQTEGGDVRIKGLIGLQKKTKSELEELSQALGMELPSVLSSPNVGGMLERTEDGFHLLMERSGIIGLFDFPNNKKYVLNKDGVRFKMYVHDLDYYRYDNDAGTLVKERSTKRWLKFKFPPPSKDSAEIDPFVTVVTDFVMQIMEFLGSGLIVPKIWSTNFIYGGVPTPSIIIQKLRKRIIENEDLYAMLDLSTDASEEQLSERFNRLMDAIRERRVPLADSEVTKLENAGKRFGLL